MSDGADMPPGHRRVLAAGFVRHFGNGRPHFFKSVFFSLSAMRVSVRGGCLSELEIFWQFRCRHSPARVPSENRASICRLKPSAPVTASPASRFGRHPGDASSRSSPPSGVWVIWLKAVVGGGDKSNLRSECCLRNSKA